MDHTLLLGTFHTAMNLLGCIGEIMLQGKAYSRVLRGNFIVVQALSSLLYGKYGKLVDTFKYL